MASNMLSLPKGLSTLQSLSVQPCWQGLPVETLYVPAEGGFQPALLRCSAKQHQQSRQKHFLTSTAPLKQRGTLLPDGVCQKSQEQRPDLALGYVLPPARVGYGDGHGDSLQACGKSAKCPSWSGCQCVEHLTWAQQESSGRERTDCMNALFLVPCCCSPPLQVTQ